MRIRRLLATALLATGMVVTMPGVAHAETKGEIAKCLTEAADKYGPQGKTPDNAKFDEEAKECYSAPSPIIPAVGEIFWGGLSFLIVVGALMKFGFPALKKGLADREAKIREDLEAAEAAKLITQVLWDDLNFERRSYDRVTSYSQSKLANVLFSQALARRLKGSGVVSNSLHPGVIATKLLKEGFGMDGGGSLKQGAATSVHVALAPELETVSGRYFDASREAPMARAATVEADQEKLWALSESLTGVVWPG